MTTYLNTVMGLGLSDYVSYNAAEEELSGYGLDEPQLVVETEYTTENEDGKEETGTFTLSVSRDPEEKRMMRRSPPMHGWESPALSTGCFPAIMRS